MRGTMSQQVVDADLRHESMNNVFIRGEKRAASEHPAPGVTVSDLCKAALQLLHA